MYGEQHTDHLQVYIFCTQWLLINLQMATKEGILRKKVFAHSLFLQVVSHLLMLMLRQLLVPVAIVLGEDCLDLCIRVPLSVRGEMKEHTSVV